MLAILGRAVFGPFKPKKRDPRLGLWGRIADRVIRRPKTTLIIGILIFSCLALGIIGYKVGGFNYSNAPAASDSAQGTAVIAAHFPGATSNPELLLLKFNKPIWSNLNSVAEAQQKFTTSPLFKSISGPLSPLGISLTATQLQQLHSELGPAALLPPTPPLTVLVSPRLYQAYRASAQFISPNGQTVQWYGTLVAGPGGSSAATAAIPAVRSEVNLVAGQVGAVQNGVYGEDAVVYDISHTATSDLQHIIPVVLLIIAILLALLLRSLVAPWYLIATVGLSYLGALGFAMIVFVHIGGEDGLNFILPFLTFIFSWRSVKTITSW